MASQHKSSNAEIRRPAATQLIRIVEYTNPEKVFPKYLQQYFLEIGFSSLYPNFKNLRIGAVHPFALLLFQDVNGQKLDTGVFPSITVSDTSDTEIDDELGRGYNEFQIDSSGLAKILGAVDQGKLILSDENRTRLEAAVADGATVKAVKHNYRSGHNIDLNIWSENKDLTSLIYDLVKHWVIGNIQMLHDEGIDVVNTVSGRRSGDINVEFGRILYGANVTVPATIETANLLIDLPYGAIQTINNDSIYQTVGE